jgi:hypothetical protein
VTASPDQPATGSALGHAAYRAGRTLGHAEVLARRLPVPPPWLVLGALVLASWGIVAEVGRIAAHDGPLYYHGGAGTWYYTTSWALVHGRLPNVSIGYGYPLLIAPFVRSAGPSLLRGLPSIIGFNQIVLTPIALLCVYGIVRTVASRWYAYLVTLFWVVFPVLVIHYFLADYHSRYVDQTLPSALGLTDVGEYPAMVALLVAAYFTVRHVGTRVDLDAVAAGLAAGLAVAIKPANVLFLPAPVVALLIGRRPRGLAFFALAVVPGLIGVAIWELRGPGHLPGLSSLDWSHLHHNLDGFREYTWSQRMIYFTAVGGLIGLARRSFVLAGLSGTWILLYLLAKGSILPDGMADGTFLTQMIPAFPAYFILVVSLPYLVPILGGRRPRPRIGRTGSKALPIAACAVLGVVTAAGILTVGLLPQQKTPSAVEVPSLHLFVPLDVFPLTAGVHNGAISLSWRGEQPGGAQGSYAILRDPADAAACAPSGRGAGLCTYAGTQVATTGGRTTSFVDHPPPGRWTYRVAFSATPVGPQSPSDYTMISAPVSVRARPGGQGI